jgi:iron complex outermembrane recepter protein
MKLALFSFLFTLCGVALYSQSVTFNISDNKGYSLPGANVVMINLKDNTQFIASAEIDGNAKLLLNGNGLYSYEVTFVGYATDKDTIEVNSSELVKKITLVEALNVLGEVKVVGKRPLIRQDGERTIVDPEPMLGSVSNTLELLTVTPGLFVDQDGGIFLGNSTPAVIYINGREQRLSANDIANILRSLPPDNILRIEILRNPSAKFDASSSGGIINVVLKKGVKIGRFGSVNTGFNQGNLGNRFIGINLYDTGSKSGTYINLNYNKDALLDEMTSLRKSNAPFILNQGGNTERRSDNWFLGAGYNNDFSDKWSFTYDLRVNGSVSNSFTDYINTTTSFDGKALSRNTNVVEDRSPSISHNHDFSLVNKLDTSNSTITYKLTLSQNWNDNTQQYENVFTLPNRNGIFGEGETDRRRNLLQSQIDLVKQFTKEFRLESGLKYNFQTFNNDGRFLINNSQNQLVNDAGRNSQYDFREGIFAAYAQISHNFKNKISLTTGIRAESTNMNGDQIVPADTSFKVSRIDPFPFLFVSRDLIKMAGFPMKGFLTFRRTLSRPSYQNLSPAVRVLDLYNYQAGNPNLKPQFTNNVEFKIGFDDVEVLAFGKNYTSGIISNVLYNDPNNPELTVNTFDNVGKIDESYFKFVGALPPVFKYFFVFGGQYNYIKYDGLYNGAPINFARGSWQFYTFHRYNITPNTSISLQGFILQDGQRNLLELGDFGQLSFSVSQKFLDKKLSISLYARDVLRTMNTQFRLAQGNVLFEGEQYRDNQRFGATIRYNFGIPTKKNRESESTEI